MNKQDVMKGLSVISGLHLANTPDLSNTKETSQIAEVWFHFLSKYTYEQYKIAIIIYAKSNKFFPTISQILECMPISNKYENPVKILKLYLNEDYENKLIKQAFNDCGYCRFDLKNMSNDILERYVKPRVEKYYKALIEEAEFKNDLQMLGGEITMIEDKKE